MGLGQNFLGGSGFDWCAYSWAPVLVILTVLYVSENTTACPPQLNVKRLSAWGEVGGAQRRVDFWDLQGNDNVFAGLNERKLFGQTLP